MGAGTAALTLAFEGLAATRKARMTASADDTVHEVIVIGSGPAGYTAALYTARAQLAPLVFEGTSFGGALMTTTEVENYPGFRDGITGPGADGRDARAGAALRRRPADGGRRVGVAGRPGQVVVTADGETYRARAVILAMGAAARYLDVPGEQELLGRGVSRVPPATASSSVTRTSPSSAAATPRWRRPPS